MGGNHLAAAATQSVVLAARARFRGVAPGPERTERTRCRPVGRERIDPWSRAVGGGWRWRCEAAGGELAARFGADEEVAARAAVDRELGEERAIRTVVREHRRVRAVDLHAQRVALRRREDARE